MVTFLICLVLLVAAYFTYGKYVERLFGAKKGREVPSKTHFDGVDYIPMPMWRTFLIQFLNIAGLGPIFGAILGAAFGPVVFLWITFGGILIGAVQDYASGMMSIAHKGLSFPEIVGIYLGKNFKQFMRLFTVFLMVLVGAVFMVGPAGLLSGLTTIDTSIWIGVILVYYIVATLLPIDKIIGRIYPVFGFCLLFMALSMLAVLIFGSYHIPELTGETLRNMKSDSANFPLFPVLFITVACGAVSGFHATQSPLMARCVTCETQGRPVFFGAMIVESIVALIWAAIAMAFFGGVEGLNANLVENGNNTAWVVNEIANSTLGKFGAVLALLGVVFAPITSGDTAFRSARLIVADFMHLEQKSMRKRLYISIPLFVIGFGITLMNFDVIWRYFAWANQTLAAISLWAVTIYLVSKKSNFYIALFPAILMTMIVSTYLFTGKEMLDISYGLGVVLGGVITLVVTVVMISLIKTYKKHDTSLR
ncbi:MAG: carbon starvation protein A [Rikenellaceae bacterium]|jgi:carbon starvation protein CstA|nr:carbon starvation protein A [Rikenellaceae bacterium]